MTCGIHNCCCRYEGEFQNGQRHGYGTLCYATGAKYQGQWQLEQKHGRGVFIFEDGTVFDGLFAQDQPVLKAGEPWAPVGPGVKLRIQDLLEDHDNKQVLPSLFDYSTGTVISCCILCSWQLAQFCGCLQWNAMLRVVCCKLLHRIYPRKVKHCHPSKHSRASGPLLQAVLESCITEAS